MNEVALQEQMAQEEADRAAAAAAEQAAAAEAGNQQSEAEKQAAEQAAAEEAKKKEAEEADAAAAKAAGDKPPIPKEAEPHFAAMRRKHERELAREREARVRAEERARTLQEMGHKPDAAAGGDSGFKYDVPEPQPENFETHVEFLKEWIRWDRKREAAEASFNSQRDSQGAEFEKQRQTLLNVHKTGEEKYEDFSDVAFIPDTPSMVQLVTESEKAADIAYYFGQNKAEAIRIARLSPLGQAREIAKLEATIAARKPVSKVPAPPATVTGKTAGAQSFMDASANDEEAIDADRKRRAQNH